MRYARVRQGRPADPHRRLGGGQGKPSAAGLAASAALQAKALGHPFIILARPGYYGSSGIANDQYRRREALLVSAALDAIKQRHAIARFGVSAQSGGGPSLAGLLAMRSDIGCAAFSSSLTAFEEREQTLKGTTSAPPLHQVTPVDGLPDNEIAARMAKGEAAYKLDGGSTEPPITKRMR